MDDLLIPINDYHSNLQREIDEAEWMGDFYQADFIKRELEDVKHMIDTGQMYYPLFW